MITDWGGVLTSPIRDSVHAWLAADLIDPAAYRTVMRAWVTQAYRGGADNPIHQLERGEGDPADFERALAAQLARTDGTPVQATGLLGRMFAGTLPVPQMYDLMRTVRKAGFRTCLLSNSWGRVGYPRDIFPELFDAWVISAEVGMRKPEERIFRHAAGLLGLPPSSACSSTTSRPTSTRPPRSAWWACTTASRCPPPPGSRLSSASPSASLGRRVNVVDVPLLPL